MGDLYRLDVAESKYGNQIAQSPTIFEREAFKLKNICIKCKRHQKSILWTQNRNRKRLQ